MDLDKIFLGITTSAQRQFLVALFTELVKKHPKLIVSTCGEFHIVRCAIAAGYKPENIVASDVSLFSSILGYFYMGTPIDKLKFKLSDEFADKYKKYTSEPEKVAFVLVVMKMQQLNPDTYYENVIREELQKNFNKQIKLLAEKLVDYRKDYAGITYKIADLREEMIGHDDKTVFTCDPPIYTGGYEKMFDWHDAITWESGIVEFDLKKEFENLYLTSREQPYLGLWARYRELGNSPESDIIFAEEKNNGMDFWLSTKPKLLEGFRYLNYVKKLGVKKLVPFGAPMWRDDDEVTPDSKVQFVSVGVEVALYYRDLWCHRLGTVKAEHYFLMLIDGKIVSTLGFHTSELLRMQSTRVFQVFGYAAGTSRYKGLNRLVSIILTSSDMKGVLVPKMSRINRIYELKGIKTTCISRYKRVKANQGLFNPLRREKQDDGQYKILYDTDFYDRNFKESIELFLQENNEAE